MFARLAMSSSDVFENPKWRKHHRAAWRMLDRRAATASALNFRGTRRMLTISAYNVNLSRVSYRRCPCRGPIMVIAFGSRDVRGAPMSEREAESRVDRRDFLLKTAKIAGAAVGSAFLPNMSSAGARALPPGGSRVTSEIPVRRLG